jgi:DnaJ-class molecular chaperone
MNPHEILGLRPGATEKEIKAAYKKLAKKYHPDVNRDKTAEDKFKEVNEAYSMLTNPKKPEMPNYGHGFGGFGGFGDIFNETMFDQMFRGGASRQVNSVRIDPEFLIHGGTFQYTVQMFETRDRVMRPIRKTINITIEPDTPALTNIAVPGTAPNHVFLQLIPGDTNKYRVTDLIHLTQSYTIDAFQAMLGSHVEIELPNRSKIDLHFPPGTQHGTIHRIPGGGLRLADGQRGDCNIQFMVTIPAIKGDNEDDLRQQIIDYIKRANS